jgi:hypothetical protein
MVATRALRMDVTLQDRVLIVDPVRTFLKSQSTECWWLGFKRFKRLLRPSETRAQTEHERFCCQHSARAF